MNGTAKNHANGFCVSWPPVPNLYLAAPVPQFVFTGLGLMCSPSRTFLLNSRKKTTVLSIISVLCYTLRKYCTITKNLKCNY